MIYFGCTGHRGHALHRPDLGSSSRETVRLLERAGIFPQCDGGFCPGVHDLRRLHDVKQVEGHAKLTHLGGFTILAFWDRTGDTRGNSNSAFIESGEHDFDEMVRIAREQFPAIWDRFTFKVVLV